MATLTYNPNDPEAPEFTEQEQQDIQLGEQIQQAEQQLLAGKYKNAQDLEQAYIELQGKLGTQDEPEQEQPIAEDSEPEETEEQEEVQDETDDESDEVTGWTDEDVEVLQSLAGGKQEYSQMIEWAAENVPPHEIQAFNNVMDMENSDAAFFAIHALKYAYRNAVGYEGKMLTGKAAGDTKEIFRSQAELVEAMNDPRYEKDPAYRMDVEEKLSQSNLVF